MAFIRIEYSNFMTDVMNKINKIIHAVSDKNTVLEKMIIGNVKDPFVKREHKAINTLIGINNERKDADCLNTVKFKVAELVQTHWVQNQLHVSNEELRTRISRFPSHIVYKMAQPPLPISAPIQLASVLCERISMLPIELRCIIKEYYMTPQATFHLLLPVYTKVVMDAVNNPLYSPKEKTPMIPKHSKHNDLVKMALNLVGVFTVGLKTSAGVTTRIDRKDLFYTGQRQLVSIDIEPSYQFNHHRKDNAYELDKCLNKLIKIAMRNVNKPTPDNMRSIAEIVSFRMCFSHMYECCDIMKTTIVLDTYIRQHVLRKKEKKV